jgi:hypothetical protein
MFDLLKHHDHDLMLDYLIEIQKQSALEKAKEPELEEGVGLTGVGIKVCEDNDSNDQRAATTRQEFMVCLLGLMRPRSRRT